MTKEQELNLIELYRRCRQSQHFNYHASDYFMKRNNLLGIITIVLSTIVSSALIIQIFQYLNPNQNTNIDVLTILIGTISCVVTLLTILQMYLNYSDLAEKCKKVSARYGQVRRELEDLMTQKNITESEYSLKMSKINSTMTLLAEDSAQIPEHIQKKVKTQLQSDPIQNPLFLLNDENSVDE